MRKALSLFALLLTVPAWAAVSSVRMQEPAPMPILHGAAQNAVGAIILEGGEDLPESVTLKIPKPDMVSSVSIHYGNAEGLQFGEALGTAKASTKTVINCRMVPGADRKNEKDPTKHDKLWILVQPSPKASVGSNIKIEPVSVSFGGKKMPVTDAAPIKQAVGYMVAVPGGKVNGRACKAFRIPGMVRTEKGTLIGVFDARYNHEGDLCADIDVAAVVSRDGGKTWSEPSVAMDSGEGGANGNGDPCILVGPKNRIYLQSLVCHFGGGASIGRSQTGFDPDKTGQWEMVTSDNDGKTWSRNHINITKQIKKAEWTLILAGPGSGITTKSGAIVFPAQWWKGGYAEKHSCIVSSQDGGKTWKMGQGVIPGATSEAQVVELSDGSLMLNCRNENRSGKRIVYVTKDFGDTWEEHPTNNKALSEPTCQASIIRAAVPGKGEMLFFSNPKTGGRSHMTIRVSSDDGMTWSEGYEYERRRCMGYSCLALADEKTMGVIYETPQCNPETGARGIGFLRIPLSKILNGDADDEDAKDANKPKKGKKNR